MILFYTFTFVTYAHANTKHYSCNESKCSYSDKVEPLTRKEFKVKCTNPKYSTLKDLTCTPSDALASCTIQRQNNSDEDSCDCYNESPGKTKFEIKVKFGS